MKNREQAYIWTVVVQPAHFAENFELQAILLSSYTDFQNEVYTNLCGLTTRAIEQLIFLR